MYTSELRVSTAAFEELGIAGEERPACHEPSLNELFPGLVPFEPSESIERGYSPDNISPTITLKDNVWKELREKYDFDKDFSDSDLPVGLLGKEDELVFGVAEESIQPPSISDDIQFADSGAETSSKVANKLADVHDPLGALPQRHVNQPRPGWRSEICTKSVNPDFSPDDRPNSFARGHKIRKTAQSRRRKPARGRRRKTEWLRYDERCRDTYRSSHLAECRIEIKGYIAINWGAKYGKWSGEAVEDGAYLRGPDYESGHNSNEAQVFSQAPSDLNSITSLVSSSPQQIHQVDEALARDYAWSLFEERHTDIAGFVTKLSLEIGNRMVDFKWNEKCHCWQGPDREYKWQIGEEEMRKIMARHDGLFFLG